MISRLRGLRGRVLGSRVGRTAGVYTAANVLDALIPFALLPILTRTLDPVEYGIIAMFQVLVGLAGPLLGLSVHGAVLRRFFDRDRDTDLAAYIGNCVLILFASTSVVGLLFFAAHEPIEAATGVPAPWLAAVVLAGCASFITHIRLAVWQAEMKAARYGGFQLMRNAADFGLSLWLILGAGMGWEGRVIGMVSAHVAFALLALLLLRLDGRLTWRPRPDYVRNALSFGAPLIPHAFAKYVLTAADRFFLANMVGLAAAGVYLVAAQAAKGLNIVFQAVNRAYSPWLYGRLQAGAPGTRGQLVRFTYVYFAIALIAALLLGLIGPPLLRVIAGDAFAGAGTFLFWLALGAGFEGMYLMVTNYVFYAERTGLLAYATGAAAVINLVLNYILIRENGAIGAAQANAAGLLFKFLLTWWLAARVVPLPWRGGEELATT